jgi:hypothetical protein
MNGYRLGRVAQIRKVTLTPVLILAGALTVWTASPAAAASLGPAGKAALTQSASPALEACGVGAALVRPSSIVLACADGGEWAKQLNWSSWTATKATATGIVTWRACVADCATSTEWDSASTDVTLTDPVPEAGKGVLFTELELHVTGPTPQGFLRDMSLNEAPEPAVPPAAPATSQAPEEAQRSSAPSGTLGYAQIEGFWIAAGGPNSSDGSYTTAQIAAAITGAESSFLPGIIQPYEDYCDWDTDSVAGWGLWQITCGNSVPQYGSNFQMLDPWNNAEAAVYKYDYNGFKPWTTYNDGAYKDFLQQTGPDTSVCDPGEYWQINSTPPGTPSTPAPDPGSTYGPAMPGCSQPKPAPAFQAAFQASTGLLYTYDPQNKSHVDTHLGMKARTSPAIAVGSRGSEVAFQANTGLLYTYDPKTNGHVDTRLGMAAGTSPAIAASPGGGFEVAFQANSGLLYTYDTSDNRSVNTHLGMAVGTSPAITASPGGGFEVAFQANTGRLYTYDTSNDHSVDSRLGMAAGTSPSIAASNDGKFEVAFQANTGRLYTYDTSNDHSVDSNLGMAARTSPSIAASASGVFEVAFEANSGRLYTYDASNRGSLGINLGMAARTSPSIAASPSGGFEVAFQANTGRLYTYNTSTRHSVDVNLGMAPATSPAIAD